MIPSMTPVRELVAEARAWIAGTPPSKGSARARSNDLIRRLTNALENRSRKTAPQRYCCGNPDCTSEKAQALVAALDACKPALDGWAVMNHVHGGCYDGPTFGAELETLRAALDAARKGAET